MDTVDAEFLRLAARAGLWQVGFGIESGSPRVLAAIGKETTLDQVRRAVGWARDAGVDTFGFFILGLSGETPYSLEETIRFACWSRDCGLRTRETIRPTAQFVLCLPMATRPLRCLRRK